MNPIRTILAGVAGASMLVLVSAGPVWAADSPYTVTPPSVSVSPAVVSDPGVVVKAATATSSAPVSGSLPFTGGDVAGLTIAGASLTVVGVGLVARNRRRRLA